MPVVEPNRKSKKGTITEPRYDKVLMGPGKYEVTKESLFVVRVFLVKKEDSGSNHWWVVVRNEEDAEIVEEAVFRMWTYDEMVEMRKNSTKYDPIRRVHTIDHDMMNRMKLQKFMVSWSFGRDNPRLKLHHVNGVLTDESWDAMKKLQTNILRFIIEEMNDRYEFGS